MSKKMLINASHPEENRVAIVVDGILSELDIEIAGQEQTKGNIYKAVVVRVEPGLQAAFVDYGAEKMGFLQIGEIHPNLYPEKENFDGRNRPRINDILKRGQELLVQIVKEERGTKGAALTTFLSLPGRYMVLMPDSKTKGVSRKISDEKERKELKRNMAALDLPERMGYIVRTAGIGKDPAELKRDFDYLVKLHQGILNRKDQVKAPAQLYQESNLAIRSIRDYFSTEMDEVLIDDPAVFRDTKDFFSLVMPEQAGLVKQHREKRPIFSRYQIEDQIDGLARNQIPLPSGGSIVIDQTEALVAIDVNSGKMSSESGIEATAGKTNLEAAAEIGRQLRLRDLGGLIVIDFIDMRDRKRIREVEDVLRKSLRDDKAKVTVGRISQFGLLEMSRQRIKAALSVGAYLDCPHCQGKGRIKSVEAQAVALLRQFHAATSKGQIGKVEARVPLDVATYLLNEKRSALGELEKQLDLAITIEGLPSYVPGQVEVELHKREKQPEKSLDSAPISHANQIEGALAAQQEQPDSEKVSEEQPAATETHDGAAAVEESSGRKRRRRRRKRSDRRESSDQTTETLSTEAPESEQTVSAEPIATESASAEESRSDDNAAAVSEKQQAKPRSRRSPRKTTAAKKKVVAETAPVESDVPPATEDVSAPVEAKPEEKPKRRSRRKAPAKQSAEATEETPAAEQNVPAQTSAPQTESKAAPKRRSTRKTATKAKTPAASVEGATETSAPTTEQDTTAPDKPAPEEQAKPKRPRRKTKPATEAAQSEPDPQEKAGDIEASGKNPESKPKRRSPRKAAPAKTTETVQPADVTEAAEAEKKPQRRTRKKPTPKQKEGPVPEEQPAAVKQPKRQPAKKADTAKPVSETKSEDKPKRRAPRKAKTSKSGEGEAAITQEQTEPKPKRRAPRKKTPPKTEPPAAD